MDPNPDFFLSGPGRIRNKCSLMISLWPRPCLIAFAAGWYILAWIFDTLAPVPNQSRFYRGCKFCLSSFDFCSRSDGISMKNQNPLPRTRRDLDDHLNTTYFGIWERSYGKNIWNHYIECNCASTYFFISLFLWINTYTVASIEQDRLWKSESCSHTKCVNVT